MARKSVRLNGKTWRRENFVFNKVCEQPCRDEWFCENASLLNFCVSYFWTLQAQNFALAPWKWFHYTKYKQTTARRSSRSYVNTTCWFLSFAKSKIIKTISFCVFFISKRGASFHLEVLFREKRNFAIQRSRKLFFTQRFFLVVSISFSILNFNDLHEFAFDGAKRITFRFSMERETAKVKQKKL